MHCIFPVAAPMSPGIATFAPVELIFTMRPARTLPLFIRSQKGAKAWIRMVRRTSALARSPAGRAGGELGADDSVKAGTCCFTVRFAGTVVRQDVARRRGS